MTSAISERLDEMKRKLGENNLAGSTDDHELAARKQELIVERAAKVLFDKGFHGASMRDIAKACSMSFGQLYHYISSKDDILYLMHKHMQRVWYENLAGSGFEEIDDPYERFHTAVRSSIEFICRNRKLILFLYSESKYLEKKHLKLVLDIDNGTIVDFYRHLIRDLPGLKLGDYEIEIGANLISFIQVFQALRGWNLDREREAEQIDFIVDFIFRGLGLPVPAKAAR